MSKTFCIIAVVLLTLGLCSIVSANELVNGSFETGNLTGWSQDVPGGGGWDYPAGEAKDGTKPARWIKSYYNDNSPDNKIWQTVATAPGLYNITFNGWVKRYVLSKINALQPDWGFAKVELLVDDSVIWSQSYSSNDAWNNFSYTTAAPVQVNQSKGVRLTWGLVPDNIYNTKNWDVVLADGWNLTSTQVVPEPASMLALLGGLAGLVIKRRK